MDEMEKINKVILILGGTGLLGKPVAHSLAAAGYQARIMTRDPKKAKKIFDSSFEIIAGDPTDNACLEVALAGCYGVHISMAPEVEQEVAEAVARLAPKYGMKRITYISGATVAEGTRWSPMINRKFLAEKAIQASGIPYTIFCPTWVMDSLPLFINQGQAVVFGTQPYPYHWIAAQDIAKMVTASYGLEEAAGKRFPALGPEAISLKEALTRYCTAFHPEIKKVSSMPFWLVSLLGTLTRNQALKGVGEMMAYFEKVGEGSAPENVDSLLGVPAITLEMWLRQSATRESLTA